MADEFEAGLIHIDQGAEGFVGGFIFGAGVHQRALRPGEGQGIAIGLQQVLADFRADALYQITDVAQDRVIAPHRVRALQQVEQADQAQYQGHGGERPEPVMLEEGQAGEGEDHARGKKGITAQE
ncbi:hypothetical protein D3C73_616710 [compost metagenome]